MDRSNGSGTAISEEANAGGGIEPGVGSVRQQLRRHFAAIEELVVNVLEGNEPGPRALPRRPRSMAELTTSASAAFDDALDRAQRGTGRRARRRS